MNGFKDFDKQFQQQAKGIARYGCGMIILQAVLAVGGIIGTVYGVLWVLRHFGIL